MATAMAAGPKNKAVVDLHCHVLPGVDDGSQSPEESVSMLNALAAQGVRTVAATPHFYANRQSLKDFLERRELAYGTLLPLLTPQLPKIMLGAEVRFYDGISRMEGLRELCLSGTELLLLEMPEERWSRYTLDELERIGRCGRLRPVLAHVERCMPLQGSEVWDRLLDAGFLMQFNASCMESFLLRRWALRALADERLHVIGSDCHNMTSRAPKIGMAVKVMEKKLGSVFTRYFSDFSQELIS